MGLLVFSNRPFVNNLFVRGLCPIGEPITQRIDSSKPNTDMRLIFRTRYTP